MNPIWKYFEKMGPQAALCKTCREPGHFLDTQTLWAHLQFSHFDMYKRVQKDLPKKTKGMTRTARGRVRGKHNRVKKSDVWNYFEIQEPHVLCNLCSRAFSLSSSTSSLRYHLTNCHKEDYPHKPETNPLCKEIPL